MSGPRTRCICGSADAGIAAPGWAGFGAGAGDVVGPRWAQAVPSPAERTAASIRARRRLSLRIMAARYTLTETYDRRTLTVSRGRPRFVTLPRRRMDHRKE